MVCPSAREPDHRSPSSARTRRSKREGRDAWRAPQAPRSQSAANLRGWLNEPYVKEAVIAVLKAADMPLMLREVAEAAGFPTSSASRVLHRLYTAGQTTRYKLPIQRHAYCLKRKVCVPGGATRMLFVYSWLRR